MSYHGGADTNRVLTRIPQDAVANKTDEGVRCIRFVSRGTVLLIGPSQYVTPAVARLAQTLRVLACISGAAPNTNMRTNMRANPVMMSARIAAVSGYLGKFTATAHGKDGQMIDVGLFSPNSDGYFDLVLDLNTPPLLTVEVRPLGYYAPPTIDSNAIDAAIAQLETLTGAFHKTSFLNFDKELCAHAAKGVAGCSRCLRVCPAGAISSNGATIAIDANLCQGCATCTFVCPSGAVSYAAPPPQVTLQRLVSRLAEGTAHGENIHRLLIHEESDRDVNEFVPAIDNLSLRFAVPVLASVGIELWMTALAQGVAQVVVRVPPDLPTTTRDELQAQAGMAQTLLTAIGENPHRVVVTGCLSPYTAVAGHEITPHPPLFFPLSDASKRHILAAALDRLQASFGTSRAALPASIDLPEDAPFGVVEVNGASCTLCKACVHLCSSGALFSNETLPSLNFTESLCVQCHLCERACPENSITLRQRLLLDPVARQAARILKVLNADAQHHCPECDAPFIGQAMLDKTLQIMRDNALFDDAEINLLKRCPACRAQSRVCV